MAGLTLLKSTESDRSSFGWTVRSLLLVKVIASSYRQTTPSMVNNLKQTFEVLTYKLAKETDHSLPSLSVSLPFINLLNLLFNSCIFILKSVFLTARQHSLLGRALSLLR